MKQPAYLALLLVTIPTLAVGATPHVVLAEADVSVNSIEQQLQSSGFDPKATKSFIHQAQAAAKKRDARQLVSLVRFPFTLYEAGRPLITYHQPEALMRDFPLIFTKPVLAGLEKANYQSLFVNGNGAMVSDGLIWFDQRKDGIKIKAINGDRTPLKR
jgi:hypothetical protein